MTVIVLPDSSGSIPIYALIVDLPAGGVMGEVASVVEDHTLRQFDGTSWVIIADDDIITSILDTASIDLVKSGYQVSANLKLSAGTSDAGNLLIANNIASDGLRSQISNNSILGLFSGTAPIVFTAGVYSIPAATALVDGYLTATDWTVFNNKVPTIRSISTTAPLTGGGDFSADRTFAINLATTAADGYLSATDWTTFNAKVATSRSISTTAPLTGGGDLSADRTLSIPAATTLVDGYLSATDWATFNAKVATARTISTTSPLTGGGDLSADRTFAIPAATTLADGYLSATDWNTFNSKQSTVSIGSLGAGDANGLSISSGVITAHPATITQPGLITSAAQSIAGDKTFTGNVIAAQFQSDFLPGNVLNTFQSSTIATTTVDGTSMQLYFSGFSILFTIQIEHVTQGNVIQIGANYNQRNITVLNDTNGMLYTSGTTGLVVSKGVNTNRVNIFNYTGLSGSVTFEIRVLAGGVTNTTAWA
jgi:hypothetical protein